MGIAKVREEELRVAVAESISMSEMLQKVGVCRTGGNYTTAKKRIENLRLDTSHWLGQASSRGKRFPGKSAKPLDEILVRGSSYDRGSLKRRLLKEGLLSERCEVCQMSDWQGKTITLQLDHINGVNDDHRLENLRLLCPNCHSQTNTFAGRNQQGKPDPCPDCGGPKGYRAVRCQPCHVLYRFGKRVSPSLQAPAGYRIYRSSSPVDPTLVCPTCRRLKSERASQCKKCASTGRCVKADWPPVEELLQQVRDTNFSAVGRSLGVSDNAVRKHLRVRLGPDWKQSL